jgi:hypothetical protein
MLHWRGTLWWQTTGLGFWLHTSTSVLIRKCRLFLSAFARRCTFHHCHLFLSLYP